MTADSRWAAIKCVQRVFIEFIYYNRRRQFRCVNPGISIGTRVYARRLTESSRARPLQRDARPRYIRRPGIRVTMRRAVRPDPPIFFPGGACARTSASALASVATKSALVTGDEFSTKCNTRKSGGRIRTHACIKICITMRNIRCKK